jgi:hypothetical protein
MQIQLDFFQNRTEIEQLQDQICILEKSLEKQRKAQFGQIGAINKKYIDLQDRFDVLERMLCKGKYGNLL